MEPYFTDLTEEADTIGDTIESHAVLSMAELVEEEGSPTLQGVLMTQSHLHTPNEEVEYLAVLLFLFMEGAL